MMVRKERYLKFELEIYLFYVIQLRNCIWRASWYP